MRIKVKFNHWLPRVIEAKGITLYPFVLIATRRSVTSNQVLRHELEHVYQIRSIGWLRFYLTYLREYLVGLLRFRNRNLAYSNISFELEAEKAEMEDLTLGDREELGIA